MTNRQQYLEKIRNLEQDVLRMGTVMQEAVEKALAALVQQDVSLARQTIRGDDLLDDMERQIEETCLKIIATEQPVARDLRTLFTAIKIAADLERMGDLAVNIAKIARDIGDERHIKPLIDIPRMARLVLEMARDALDAYVSRDEEMARGVIDRDEEIDAINDQIFRELLTYMMQDPHTISQATRLIIVSRALERIGDHAVNISEGIIYIEKGQID